MVCPDCGTEYRPGFTRCVDCDAALVASLPAQDDGDGERLVRLWRGADPVLHSALTAALGSAQIPYFDNPARDFGNWLSAREHHSFSYGVPNLDVHVARRYYDEAREILDALLATPDAEADDGDSPADAEER